MFGDADGKDYTRIIRLWGLGAPSVSGISMTGDMIVNVSLRTGKILHIVTNIGFERQGPVVAPVRRAQLHEKKNWTSTYLPDEWSRNVMDFMDKNLYTYYSQ